MNLSQYNDILTVEEVMELLLIGRNQCYELLNTGKLHGFKTGKRNWKIPRKAITQFLKEETGKNLFS